jgi:superoxide dismutase, Cu-Zn family
MRINTLSATAATALAGIGALALLMGPGSQNMPAAHASVPGAAAVLHMADGSNVGNVTFTSDADGSKVIVEVAAAGLPAGFHGLHVHTVGQCDAPDFTSAGAHLDPMGMAMAPMHAGDLPSLLVNEDGTGSLRAVTDRFSIQELLDGAGTAVVVHANADNFGNIPTRYAPTPDATTQATGDAGARIACGVVQPAS